MRTAKRPRLKTDARKTASRLLISISQTTLTTEEPTEETTEPETTAENENGGPANYIVNTDGLRFRADIGTDSDILAELSYGTELTVDRVVDGWGHTYYDGNEGWVSLDYLDEE